MCAVCTMCPGPLRCARTRKSDALRGEYTFLYIPGVPIYTSASMSRLQLFFSEETDELLLIIDIFPIRLRGRQIGSTCKIIARNYLWLLLSHEFHVVLLSKTQIYIVYRPMNYSQLWVSCITSSWSLQEDYNWENFIMAIIFSSANVSWQLQRSTLFFAFYNPKIQLGH